LGNHPQELAEKNGGRDDENLVKEQSIERAMRKRERSMQLRRSVRSTSKEERGE